MKRTALTTVALSLALTACGDEKGALEAPQPRPERPIVLSAGFCLDGTLSSSADYAPRLLGVMADALAGWTPPAPAQLLAGAPSAPGLVFAARSVTTTSNSTDGTIAPVHIAPVVGFSRQPDPKVGDFRVLIRQWVAARNSYTAARDNAQSKARAASATVRALPIVRRTSSGIYNCLGALSEQLGHTRPALIVASDMQDNRPLVTLRLQGARVLMVTICPASSADSCPTRFRYATTTLKRHGASSVRQLRADAVTSAALVEFIEEI